VISPALARELRLAGLTWTPAAGDRFLVMSPGMEDDVFYLADMTVEVHHFVDGPVIGFNGTTEWALDSVDLERALWLPREDQLRTALGGVFLRLERDGDTWVVVTRRDGQEHREEDPDPEHAFARALLSHLTSETAPGSARVH
jgi:hypothetical protein